MVEVDPLRLGATCPAVPPGEDSVNIDTATEDRLEKAGYIIGRLQRVIFSAPGVKDTNWRATHHIVGVDGVGRRWVYLHYFKEGQPTINWLDPTFAGMRLVIGDALHSLERPRGRRACAWMPTASSAPRSRRGRHRLVGRPPAVQAANQFIASMVRKVGGFTFQELNLAIDDIKATSIAAPTCRMTSSTDPRTTMRW